MTVQPAVPNTSLPSSWPSPVAVLSAAVLAAAAVAADAWFSAQEGYLSRAPDYDGVSYLSGARSAYELLTGGHLRTALAQLNGSLAPLWVAAMDVNQLILGRGTWQSFTARFWAVGLLLLLVWWIVRRRGGPWLAAAAMGLTAVLPAASAAVRGSSLEFLSGRADYGEIWSLDDLRPDFFAIVLVLWSIAPLAEHVDAPRRSTYLMSGAFAAAAVLAKPSTAPFSLGAWALAMLAALLWNRRRSGILGLTTLGAAAATVLLLPWAAKGGVVNTVTRLHDVASTFHAAYNLGLDPVSNLSYYAVRLPILLGAVEVWPVAAAVLGIVAAAPLRRRLARAEWMYGGLFAAYLVFFTATPSKNPLVGLWVALPLWILFVAAASRSAGAEWTAASGRRPRLAVGVAAGWMLAVYLVGALCIANWPANERRSNQQLASVTAQIADEMRHYVSSRQCFAYAPGPGWPASLEYLMTDAGGRSPSSTPVDVDPSMPLAAYVGLAAKCPAVLAYREDISAVSQMFVAYPVRQPYLRAVAEWVRGPQSGYTLDRSWRFTDLASNSAHTLGRYDGITLTVDLYVRRQAG